ncbi:hypothetical protein KR51_00000780 [Rubidibacter lacunae KORDI 51-2]|uniref:Uncharacterized protein n=1 Tax=Rubidibacter lacunae KORDI 51-2 TaxID=582515 RepID=U5DU25_9CHRO|nr:hypothetical protein KR51_00000780 [Rubidibacter lacunae KORDI 51-2]
MLCETKDAEQTPNVAAALQGWRISRSNFPVLILPPFVQHKRNAMPELFRRLY